MTLAELLRGLDLAALRAQLDEQGHAHLPRLLTPAQCEALLRQPALAGTLTCLDAGQFQPLACDEAPAPNQALVLAALLSPAQDFSGGELVMTEQRPRQQSRPMVVPLAQGDAVLMRVGARTVQGTHGPYRAVLRHGIARVREGRRLGWQHTFPPDAVQPSPPPPWCQTP